MREKIPFSDEKITFYPLKAVAAGALYATNIYWGDKNVKWKIY